MDTTVENSILELHETEKVFGLIYEITNCITNVKYIGQTVSHRKNKNKLRPFGIMGRFKDHISEAMNNTKRKQCSYLNNAIRKYGPESFTVKLIEICLKDDLNAREEFYIHTYDTLYPKGYNLTKGGKNTYIHTCIDHATINIPKKHGGCKFRSDETRAKMSERLKELSDETACLQRSHNGIRQHHSVRMETFKSCGCVVDPMLIESYIHKKGNVIIVRIGECSTTFAGKHQTIEQKKERAVQFIHELIDATLSNCGEAVKHE